MKTPQSFGWLAVVLGLWCPLAPIAAESNGAVKTTDTRRFADEIRSLAAMLKLPGLSLAVVHDGEIIYQQQEGFADVERRTPVREDSIFWLASITKSFSAALLAQYEQEGAISLDDPVMQYPFASVGFFPQRIHPGVCLKHVLSHTSEGVPGERFVYHGGRYNFVYGVFQKMSGLTAPDALHRELSTRILGPLKMESTLLSYPDADAPLHSRVVTPYRFDGATGQLVVNQNAYMFKATYAATGLLSSLKDLAMYAGALDQGRVISKAVYERMTSPVVNSRGETMPYGLGWFTQRLAGITLHWAYGYGDSDSALFLRVPDRKLTFIFLTNCDRASGPFQLGYGNVLRSPFALAFLKHFVFPEAASATALDYDGPLVPLAKALRGERGRDARLLDREELQTQALLRSFTRNTYQPKSDQPEALAKLLFELDPAAFDRVDAALTYLMSQLDGADLAAPVERLARAYEQANIFHPEILRSFARCYERQGDNAKALVYYHRLADTPGFEEQGVKQEACLVLAKHYLERKDYNRARSYAWNALVYARQTGNDDRAAGKQIEAINQAVEQARRPAARKAGA